MKKIPLSRENAVARSWLAEKLSADMNHSYKKREHSLETRAVLIKISMLS